MALVFCLYIHEFIYLYLLCFNVFYYQTPGYTVSNYIEDKQMWNSMQGVYSPPFSSKENKDSKKLRKSPALTNPEGKYNA